ncbi:hypothetical protein LSTR_LSTR010942 [Laodelphax striatellus]|uniref:Tubulin delta chain n=1 Tax=Laodelphax striatellus TaxID=195883 RepID=A0A482XT77_LAOST|nr:hypothetical protein LSTR_LSTR010942 [Laodelphax striatellus]
MSYVSLQFGQCGNQLGHELYSTISEDLGLGLNKQPFNDAYFQTSRDYWFRESTQGKLTARAIMVDTEKKVIDGILSKSRRNSLWKYSDQNAITNRISGGSGNNWALGYSVRGAEISEVVLNCVRKELETCDRVDSILCLSSAAGGTGSGVGCFITTQLADEFPGTFIVNTLVLPFESGEVITQNYNTLLALAKLYDTSHGIYLIENDELHRVLTSELKISNTDYNALNKVLAEQLGCIYQPMQNEESPTQRILDLFSHPSYKLASIWSSPHVSKPVTAFEPVPKWEALERSIEKNLKIPFDFNANNAKDYSSQYYRSVANLIVCRGPLHDDKVRDSFLKSRDIYPKWMVPARQCQTVRNERTFLRKDKFITLVSNSSRVKSVLDRVLDQSWQMFVHKAYLHQYSKYGLNNEEMLQTILKCETILKDYKCL